MTTTIPQPLMPQNQDSAVSQMKTVLLEPLLVLGTCLFWLAVLPVTGLFCASVALYDKVASLKTSSIRLPDLRHNQAHNPLVLRKKSAPQPKGHLQPRDTAQAFQS